MAKSKSWQLNNGLGMEQSGETTDGRPVYAKVFPLVGTHGVPLEVILHRFKDSGHIMDWPDYVAVV